jgi:endoglucanase
MTEKQDRPFPFFRNIAPALSPALSAIAILLLCIFPLCAADLRLNDQDYFEAQGLSVLLFHNAYHGVFGDEKMSGVEIILHGDRIATNGDVRLSPTPEQWDPIPQFKDRKRSSSGNQLIASLSYPDRGLTYHIALAPEADGFRVTVQLDQPLPPSLVGKAGFNLEFLPTSYFGKCFILDTGSGIFPHHPNGPMQKDANGTAQPTPIATGQRIVLSPEDPLARVTISSDSGPLMLFDGRNKAQNGWFVVRTLIPSGATQNAVVWHIHPHLVSGWTRPPVVAYNQVGYTPQRTKVAVIELDPLFDAPKTARVLRLASDGEYRETFRGEIKPWGKWLRYQYARFDFSSLHEPGMYAIEYAGHLNAPFRIAKEHVWQASLDTYLPVQMDHVKVREGYRIWHGPSHLDDARQAPVNYTHFDGYSMGPSTDSPFAPGEHIPGLDRGGWYDAGDYDIRTESQARVVTDLALAREYFQVDWDETTVNEKARSVQIRVPDGIPDAIQQVQHGVIGILAQYHAIGHAIPGIIEPTLQEYTHLGDAASQTDGRIYSSRLGPLETDGTYSGVPDDRWAFTTHTTPLDYLAISSLAAASRVLHDFDDSMSAECLQTAVRKRLKELLPEIQNRFAFLGWIAARAVPLMDPEFKEALASALRSYKAKLDEQLSKNPYGVPIATGTWGGAGAAAGFSVQMYFFHKTFPDIVGPEYTLRGFDYVLGTHPVSNLSFVSSVGTQSKLIAYGNNRADYTFIPGGIVPGVIIIQPDFPELKEAWPFLWYENEYVVDTVANYILAANAANAVAQ